MVGSKSCAHVSHVAGICKMVLHGTVMVMPFRVTVPPQRIGSTPGHIDPSSNVADWMNPSMSNCGVGEGTCCAWALAAKSTLATNDAMATKVLPVTVWCPERSALLCTLVREPLRFICPPQGVLGV